MANGLVIADIPGAFERGLQFKQQQQLRPLGIQQAELGLKGQQLGIQRQQQQLGLGELQQQSLQQQMDIRSDEEKNKSLFNAALTVSKLPDDQIVPFLKRHIEAVQSKFKGNAEESIRALELAEAGQFESVRAGAENLIDIGIKQGDLKPSKQDRQTEFEELTKDLPAEQKKEATLIKLGISPRAVGSAIQTISDRGIEEQIGKSSATIKQREKFGELTGASRAKTIDQGVEKIAKINLGLGNIDRAISALNRGAGVGAIQRFLPSFKAASVELDNIQKSMALDVIGAVTFGALSEGELNLAKEVALPTGLNTPQLIQHLQDRKTAQEKLKNYYSEQIQFLDQGGTVAGFLQQKEQETQQAPVFNSSILGRQISEQDIQDTLQSNPGITREQLFQQLGIQ